MILLPTNEFQTPITEELRDSLPTEVWDDFMDIITNTEFIKSLISPERKRAKDLPRDSYGRIIVDVCHPHILENMDYFRQSAIYFQKYGCYTKLLPNPNPKSEFGMWLTREVTRCLEGMVRPEDGEWIPGDMYFYLNYFPIIQTKLRKGSKIGDRIVDFPEFWEGVYLRFHYLNQARNGGIYDDFVGAKHAVEIASRGRAIEVNELVETPEGLKLWKDIKIGDYLFGNHNTITKVVNIPFVGESPCYKITLRDGRTITASDNHIWNVYKRNSKKPILKTTLELFNEYKHSHKISSRVPKGIEYIYSIPSNEGVEFEENTTQIDPYTFGLLLGDGCFKHLSCYYTCETTDFDIIKQYIPYQYTKWKDKYAYRIHIPNWRTLLKFYKLVDKGSEDKFIPREFKYNSRKVRLSLLQGLMDTDGYVSTDGIPIFTTVSEFLCQDIMWLARSLGYNCSFKKHPAGYKKDGIYKRCKDVYIVKIYGGPEVFKLPRKSNLVNYKSNYAKSRRDSTRIINIEFVGNKQCKCVTVDALDDSFLIGDFIQTHNSKSYSIAAIMCKMFLLGESMTSLNKVKCTIVADQKEFLIKDGSLNKFVDGIDFCSKYTQFPKARLKNSLSEMQWVSGYLDKETNIPKGTQNEVLGIAIKDDADKTRGKRSQRLFYEEFGTFPKFLDVWQTSLPNVQEGNVAFGLAYAIGTGGSEGSDFMGALEMINYPDGYNVYSLPNVYDKGSVGAKRTIFFFPSYMNSKGFYNEDGVSDVVGAIIDELKFRVKLKYNSSDPIQLTRRKAEYAFTITDAIMRRDSNIFPSDKLNDRILELDQNPKSLDDMWVGRLVQTKEGKVEFTPDADVKPILDYPHKDNKLEGAVHINKMPIKGPDGKVPWGRYIAGADPYDDDVSDTMSLGSIYVLDLFTDELVCEYVGRPMFAEDYYETCRRICLFYNAELLYENNKKGLFTYFSKTNCLYLLSDIPEFLKDKEIVKGNFFGNKAHPYSQLVYTPEGPKLWGDIKIGDKLFNTYGGITTVIDIPYNDKTDIYEIYLRDGRKVKASANHLWNVITNGKTYKTISTKEMSLSLTRDKGKYKEAKYYVIGNLGANFKEVPLKLPAYFMGLMLGDGCFTRSRHHQANFASSISDLDTYKKYVPYSCKTIDDRHHWWRVKNIGNILQELGLSKCKSRTKFIPDCYKFNSRENRLELLRGLLDTDGCIGYGGNPEYTTTSEQLALDVEFVARSCGINCNIQKSTNAFGLVYKVIFYTDIPMFHLERKYTKQKLTKTRAFKTAIVDIKLIGQELAKCVTVDSKDGCYLIGDFVTTHNSKGVNATQPVQTYGRTRIRDWLLKPFKVVTKVTIDGHEEEAEITINNINRCYYRALMKELSMWNPDSNFDRYDALLMLMLLREQKLMLCGNLSPSEVINVDQADYLGNDDFFTRNYDYRFAKYLHKDN